MMRFNARVLKNRPIARDIRALCFECPPEALAGYVPGQFAHVKVPQAPDHILRRPFSIASADARRSAVTIAYRLVGEGTRALARETGVLDVLMPLGNGFPTEANGRVLLVGGGMGVAPLRSAAEKYGKDADAILGFCRADAAFFTEAFEKSCRRTSVWSDDGSAGQKGLVTDALKETDLSRYGAVFACGPVPMLRALQRFFHGAELPVYASLEERMGCGMGGCAVCACGVVEEGGLRYKKVCTDGPVFPLREVVFP